MERLPKGSLFAVALIVAGSFLFLDNLALLPFDNIGAYWPLALVVYGLGRMYDHHDPRSIVWSAAIAVAGGLLVLGNLGYLRLTVGALWPLLLVAGGVMKLVDRGRWRNHSAVWNERFESKWKRKQQRWEQRREERWDRNWYRKYTAEEAPTPINGSKLNEVAVFYSINKRLETQDFVGGELVAVFGSVEIDLTGAQIAGTGTERRAELEASAVFGSVEVMVPRNWKVLNSGTGVFGSYEDRTILRPLPGEDTAMLVLNGGAVFGSVIIRN